jgi:putative ABC transport system substrate-binding protein
VRGAGSNPRPYRDRRTFIAGLGAAAAWPLAVRAQQAALPVVGCLVNGPRSSPSEIGFHEGLTRAGFEEGRNITIDHRYTDGQRDRLLAFAADLARKQPAAIYAADNASALALKAETTSIPVVFGIGGDPVQLGLVTALGRPGGNFTGVSFLTTATEAIRLQMLHDAVPNAKVVGFLVNPANSVAALVTKEMQDAARELGLELQVVSASSNAEIDTACATLIEHRAQALVIDGDLLFSTRRQQIAALMLRHALPAIYTVREFPEAGGLMSYGASTRDAGRLGGVYVARILKGEKPANLPVQQSVKFELIINLTIAKVLGLDLPLTLLGRADEVIE